MAILITVDTIDMQIIGKILKLNLANAIFKPTNPKIKPAPFNNNISKNPLKQGTKPADTHGTTKKCAYRELVNMKKTKISKEPITATIALKYTGF